MLCYQQNEESGFAYPNAFILLKYMTTLSKDSSNISVIIRMK
ncbi:hypothetical protein GMES_0066 [Paraglaciecola mesophila KMM 241]|uniref:Uncharacterized protein n=1 Tax=Paraglaciecola mesophila KMM 241 TaxID=1128912 RepID=K6YEK4_9ALTE|nr:hypothetical protein GMES_0066 [Paraglaciecola mesophila KMM 241]